MIVWRVSISNLEAQPCLLAEKGDSTLLYTRIYITPFLFSTLSQSLSSTAEHSEHTLFIKTPPIMYSIPSIVTSSIQGVEKIIDYQFSVHDPQIHLRSTPDCGELSP